MKQDSAGQENIFAVEVSKLDPAQNTKITYRIGQEMCIT